MQRLRIAFNAVKNNNIRVLNNESRQQKSCLCRKDKNLFQSTILMWSNVSKYSCDTPLKCWNCDYVYKSDLFCSKCKSLHELPENLSYFDLMGLNEDFNITHDELHKKYTELQKLLHPDKFGNKSEREKQISAKLSSFVNKAYSTLADPLRRGLYILKMNSVTIPEGTTSTNPEFLMEIMEKNEAIEEAVNDKHKVVKVLQETKELLAALSMEVSEAFKKNDLEKAKDILMRMKYYVSINNRLKKIKQDMGITD